MTTPGRRAHVKRAKTLRKADDAYHPRSGSAAWAYKQFHLMPWGPVITPKYRRYKRLANAIRSAYRGK